MTISLWRYSHLILAIASSLFILLATLTGAVLAFEPISKQLHSYAIKDAGSLSLSKTIAQLQAEYAEVIHIEIDKNDFISTSVVTKEGDNETFYINPFTAKKIGDIIEKAPIFKFATNLHRSLFLKATGRAIVGFTSFFLFLMAITGVLLIVKRQGSIKRFFSKIIKEDFKQYYHIVVGRYVLIPLLIVTISGVYLSLEKFSLLPFNENAHVLKNVPDETISSAKFNLFETLKLRDIKAVEFPFSDDTEDYYTLKLHDKEVSVNQYDGTVVSQKENGFVVFLSGWSLFLHTGEGSALWSVVLFLTCISILFFIYSGFAMTLTRIKQSGKIKNKFDKDAAEYVILVGSEMGSTFGYAKAFYKALVAEGKSVFVSELNNYTSYKKAEHLVVFTATYGDGEPPTNANHFEKLIQHVTQKNTLQYSVVGFGSLAYKGFCEYAIILDSLLQLQQGFTPSTPLQKINNKSFSEFTNWTKRWGESKNLNLLIQEPPNKPISKKTQSFKVVNRSVLNSDDSFLLELIPDKKSKFKSGDLLSIYPNSQLSARDYSIGKLDGNMLLSIKKHAFGICSNYLNELKINDMIRANIKQNKAFHVPNSAKEVVMISNGTGIAPFLGMINDENHNQTKNYLFWGGRTNESLKMYAPIIDKAFYNKKLSGLYIAFSKEQSKRKYVQDLIMENVELICRVLQSGNIIMVCGSVAMKNDVLSVLNYIAATRLNEPLETYQNKNQIRTDCY